MRHDVEAYSRGLVHHYRRPVNNELSIGKEESVYYVEPLEHQSITHLKIETGTIAEITPRNHVRLLLGIL